MKIKTLVAVAVLAMSIITGKSQVSYSINVVGCIKVVYPAGWSMIATPLKTTNNTIGEILTGAPAGTLVYAFVDGAYEVPNLYEPPWSPDAGWSNPAQTLPPGQGYFVRSPSRWTNIFTGDVVRTSTNSLHNGFNMVGSVWPAAGNMETALQLVPTPGDMIYSFNNGVGYNVANMYDPWEEAGWSFPPTLNFAQGVFYRSRGPKEWVQNFTIAP